MRTATESFIDLGDRYTLHFTNQQVRIECNTTTIYDGPVSDLIVSGEFHCISVGRVISTDLDTVPKEIIAEYAENYLNGTTAHAER